VCKGPILLPEIRYGYTVSFRGNLSTAWMHADCAPKPPNSMQLQELEGFDSLSAEVQSSLLGKAKGVPLVVD
jgi:hypothetical protein